MPGLLVVVNPPASADGREAFEKGVRALYRRAWHRTVYDTGDAATWYRAVVVEDPEVDVVRVDAERPNGRRFGVFDVAVQPGLFDGEPEVGDYLRVANARAEHTEVPDLC